MARYESPIVNTPSPVVNSSRPAVDRRNMTKESILETPRSKPKRQTWAECGVTAFFVVVFCGPVFLEALSRPLRCEINTERSNEAASGN